MSLYFGAHTADNGGLHMAAARAGRAGMAALQVFTAKPTFYNDKSFLKPARAQQFLEAIRLAGIAPEFVIVHAGYVLNVATQEVDKWERASAALGKELERSTLIGVRGVCFHPGSSLGADTALSLENVARAMTRALEQVQGNTRLFIENTAGGGNTVGRTAAEVGAMLRGLPQSLRSRAGYGLDTCHLFASGYDVRRSREHFTEILDEFESETGEPPSFFHLNDSEGELGSNRDRHALLGEGRIGVDTFRWLVGDRRAQNIPLVLETPQANSGVADDDDTPDPADLRMMDFLRSL
jgi:deoxyribonuclease-4